MSVDLLHRCLQERQHLAFTERAVGVVQRIHSPESLASPRASINAAMQPPERLQTNAFTTTTAMIGSPNQCDATHGRAVTCAHTG